MAGVVAGRRGRVKHSVGERHPVSQPSKTPLLDQTPLLDKVRIPDDLRELEPEQLRQLADELRRETIAAVAVTGGHLGAGLGVVELTVALHYVFDTPHDRLPLG